MRHYVGFSQIGSHMHMITIAILQLYAHLVAMARVINPLTAEFLRFFKKIRCIEKTFITDKLKPKPPSNYISNYCL